MILKITDKDNSIAAGHIKLYKLMPLIGVSFFYLHDIGRIMDRFASFRDLSHISLNVKL